MMAFWAYRDVIFFFHLTTWQFLLENAAKEKLVGCGFENISRLILFAGSAKQPYWCFSSDAVSSHGEELAILTCIILSSSDNMKATEATEND